MAAMILRTECSTGLAAALLTIVAMTVTACWDIPPLNTQSDGGDTDTDTIQPEGCVRTVRADAQVEEADGLTWQTAFPRVQDAIDSAAQAVEDGEDHCDVWIAAGTYPVFQGGPEDTVLLRSGVGVYGGFTGAESTLDERDPADNVSILDGFNEGMDDRVYHVVTGADGATLDGLTVSSGYAQEDEDPMNFNNYGGGMLNYNASPTVSNCVFTNNHGFFGGAIENISDTEEQSVPVITDCRFDANNAGRFGGAIDNDHSSPMISGCAFESNFANWGGGAINSLQGAPDVTDCTFLENGTDTEIDSNGGAILTYGAEAALTNCVFEANTAWIGGAVSNESASIVVDGSTFEGNTSISHGGAVHNIASSPSFLDCRFVGNAAGTSMEPGRGGAIFSEDSSSPSAEDCIFAANISNDAGGAVASVQSAADLSRCTFVGNTASIGGAVAIMDAVGALEASYCRFFRNSADQTGGGIDVRSSESQVDACILAGNSADQGGGISVGGDEDANVRSSLLVGNSSGAGGGGLRVTGDGTTTLLGCTVADNDSGSGGGGLDFDVTTDVDAVNSIFWGNTPTQAYPTPATDQVTYSVYQGGVSGAGDLNQDPLFEGMPAHIGTLGDVSFDADAVQTTITYADADWDPQTLGGRILRVQGTGVRWYVIESNTADTLTVDGDASGEMETGDSFFVDDYRLSQNSPCTDAGDGFAATDTDLLGITRVDDPDTPNTGTGPPWTDIGAYEYYPDNIFGPGPYGEFGYIGLWDADMSVCADLTASGTFVDLSSNASHEVALSAPFVFYGEDRETVFINENGAMTFDTALVNPGVTAQLPYNNIPLVAVYWDELEMSDVGDNGIYYDDDGSFFRVQWKIPSWSETIPYDIRAALDLATGVIHFCYSNTNLGSEPNGSDAVAGIQGDSANGLTYSNSEPNLITGRHVRIVPPAE